MKFAIIITGAPGSSQAPQSAYCFTSAALKAGHQIQQVFLYGDGVHLGSELPCPPRDETDWSARWHELASTHALSVTVCIASALRRGLLDAAEAQRHHRNSHNLTQGFTLGGLGDFVTATLEADRIVTFGAGT